VTEEKRQPGAADSVSAEAAGGDAEAARVKRRQYGFGLHIIGYALVMSVIVPLNRWLLPDEPWFVLPMVGWGSVLGLHAAWAMGLFELFRGGPR